MDVDLKKMLKPSPEQLAKARAIAEQLFGSADCYRHDRERTTTAIASALADETQQAEQYFVGEVAVLLVGCGINGGGPILVGIRELARNYQKMQQAMLTHGSRLADAEQRGRQAGLREAAAKWHASSEFDFEEWLLAEAEEGPSR